MKEITVRFLLSDQEEQRLRRITDGYKKLGLDTSMERMFDTIMFTGSKYDVDSKFKFHERKLGIIENVTIQGEDNA